MANPEHLAILKQGVQMWNKWQEESKIMRPDFTGANLKDLNLGGAYLRGSDLSSADLRGSNLGLADLIGTIFRGTNLETTNLFEASLNSSILIGTKISEAKFIGTNFGGTLIDNVDLSKAIHLDSVKHWSDSSISLRSITRSKGKIPEVFLRGCGLSDLEIEFAKLLRSGLDGEDVNQILYSMHEIYSGQGIQYYSCFISYNNNDQVFTQKLHDDLQDNGVRCWFAPEDMKIGDRIRPRIDQQIRLRDKLLVILSENSIVSEWVGDEVEAALEEENVSDRTILFPIRLDNAVMESRSDWAAKIKRRRHIGDFSGWQDETQYQKAFERLLRDLKSTGDE